MGSLAFGRGVFETSIPRPGVRVIVQPNSAARFPTTRWSWIQAAGRSESQEARAALLELCRAYWYPIYGLIRRAGYSPVDASDLTQDYFIRLIEGGLLRVADRDKGRFRTFLRTDCAFFLADEHDRRKTRKRGGGVDWLSLDVEHAEGQFRLEPADGMDPRRIFDRAWALTLLNHAFDRLEAEEAAAGRARAFEHLKVVLTDGPRAVPYATIAEALGKTTSIVQSAVVRLRKRYRAALRAEVAATLDDPTEAEIDEEIRSLFHSLGH